MAQSSGGAGSGSSDADPRGQTAVPSPAHPPTEAASPYLQTETGTYGPGAPGGQAGPGMEGTVSVAGLAEIVRLGPGIPVSSPPGQTGQTAQQVWRAGPPRGRRRLRRLASGALTVALLVAAGVVLFLRLHHVPLQVTGAAITGQVAHGCEVDVTGRIATNGSAGTVSYQWLYQPQSQAPQPMSQSVVAGQDAVYVTVTLEGQGHGRAARAVTLQVLGPGTGTATAHVTVSC